VNALAQLPLASVDAQVIVDAIGLGAAATKYNVFASLSNMPIAYMTLVAGSP
jgi:hypothetical protein